MLASMVRLGRDTKELDVVRRGASFVGGVIRIGRSLVYRQQFRG